MINKVSDGDRLVLIAPYARLSGEAALIGSIFGVAVTDLANGATGTFEVSGVFDLAKTAGAVTAGAKMYWDASTKTVTTVSTSNTLIGCATQAQGSGDATCRVRLGAV